VTHGIGLRENAAKGVTQHDELPDPQVFTNSLDVLHHVIQRVPFRIFKPLRAARTALIDQHQATAARQRLKCREKIGVICSRPPVQQQQRYAAAERFIEDACTTADDETFSAA
jgi:hypothetical protein